MIAQLVRVRPGKRLAGEYTKRELSLDLSQQWMLYNDRLAVHYRAHVRGGELLLYKEFVPLPTRI